TLRSSDDAIGCIHQLRANSKKISFKWMRENFGNDRSRWGELGRGTYVLTSKEQLDQYLYSYGPMISCQWQVIAAALKFTTPIRIIDYGCGQGLAGLMIFDKHGEHFSSMLKKAILIEPSDVALARAE